MATGVAPGAPPPDVIALAQLADEQAALRRVATLVAQDAAPEEIFAAVSAEVDRVFRLDPATFDVAGVVRLEPGPDLEDVGVSKRVEAVPLGSHFPPDEHIAPTHSTEGLVAARRIREELPETAVVVLSAHVEMDEATELLASGQRLGYLLKSRVTDVDDFIDTLGRILKGAAVVDPALVRELVAARRVHDPLDALSARERDVLALMAEGRSNAGIARQLWVTEGTVEKHVRSIMMKLDLPETTDDHRRVLAVLAFLERR